MDIRKRKYKQAEVLEIVNACKIGYEEKIFELKAEIFSLSEKVNELNAQLLKEREKEVAISSALLRAEQLSTELKEKAQAQYQAEIERIKKFSIAWNDYFHALREKYPHYEPVQDALKIVDALESDNENAKDAFDKIENYIVKDDERFDPKRKIRDYIAATGDNGFNLDEVLNPGELQLEEICKELGLLGGEE